MASSVASGLTRAQLEKLASLEQTPPPKLYSTCQKSIAASAKSLLAKPPLPVKDAWKHSESLKKMAAQSAETKSRLLSVLQTLDREHTNRCSYSIFYQSCVDQNIDFDEQSLAHIINKLDS